MEKDHLLIKKLVTLLYVTVGGVGEGGGQIENYLETPPPPAGLFKKTW